MTQPIFFQGAAGSFSHRACKRFAEEAIMEVEPVECRTFDEVFKKLEATDGSYAVVPFENSTVGLIGPVIDLLSHPIHVLADTILPVHHQLIGINGSTIADLKEVHSHPVALAQCQRVFETYPHLKAVPAFDTAGAVREMLERNDPHCAAIAGTDAVLDGTKILHPNVEDFSDNCTRFLLISTEKAQWKCASHPSPDRALIMVDVHADSANVDDTVSLLESKAGPCRRIFTHPLQDPPFSYRLFYEASPPSSDIHLVPVGHLLGVFCSHT